MPALAGLLAAGHDVAAVVTRPDRRRGRGAALSPSPVKQAALAAGLPVTDRADDVLGAGVELGVVVAFGQILRAPLLGGVPLVNLHFSLLPRWRGAAPVERAILAGDEETGVCLMEVEAELDSGPVYAQVRTAIGPEETAAHLRRRLAVLGRDLLVTQLAGGLGEARPQSGRPIYAPKIHPAELHLDWEQPAEQLARVVRAGRAWTTAAGQRLLVLAATPEHPSPGGPPGSLGGTLVSTGAGGLRLRSVQPAGRAPLDAEAWRRGARHLTALGP